jgi:integrase
MTTRALEDHEIKSIFEHVEGVNAKRNETLLVLAIGMALRASELTGLNVGDVFDGKRVKTYVTIRGETAKYGKEREMRVWNIVADKIAEFLEWKVEHGESIDPDAPLFVSREGGYLTRQALFEIVKKIFRAAGVKQSCHALRKTGATIFYLASSYDITATQQFLGHASPETTRRYIGIPSQKVKEYSITSSEWLANAIEYGEFDLLHIMSNSVTLNQFKTSELIVELQARGIDMTSAIEQIQAQRKPQQQGKVILFPKLQVR